MAGQQDKPFWKKWWVWLIAAVIIIGAIGEGTKNTGYQESKGVSSASSTSAPAPKQSISTSPETTRPSSSPAQTTASPATNQAEAFMQEFTGPDNGHMADIEIFDPQATDGQYYRTEYRLGAYDGAQAAHGRYGALDIDVVAYDVKDGQPQMMRVYASGPADALKSLYPYVVKHLSPSASDDQIQELLEQFTAVAYVTETPRSFKGIEGNMLQRTGANGEFMVDAKV